MAQVSWAQVLSVRQEIARQLRLLCGNGMAEHWDDSTHAIVRRVGDFLFGVVVNERIRGILARQPREPQREGGGGADSNLCGKGTGKKSLALETDSGAAAPSIYPAARSATRLTPGAKATSEEVSSIRGTWVSVPDALVVHAPIDFAVQSVETDSSSHRCSQRSALATSLLHPSCWARSETAPIYPLHVFFADS